MTSTWIWISWIAWTVGVVFCVGMTVAIAGWFLSLLATRLYGKPTDKRAHRRA